VGVLRLVCVGLGWAGLGLVVDSLMDGLVGVFEHIASRPKD